MPLVFEKQTVWTPAMPITRLSAGIDRGCPTSTVSARSEFAITTVGTRIRDLYPAKNPDRLLRRLDDNFLRALVAQVTAGFGGKVALAPRLFLRELIDVMDRVDIHEEYDPQAHYKLELDDGKLTAEELAAKHGHTVEASCEKEQDEEPSEEKPKRLDG